MGWFLCVMFARVKRRHISGRAGYTIGAICLVAGVCSLVALSAIVALGVLFHHDPTRKFVSFGPGMDGRPERSAAKGAGLGAGEVKIGEHFRRCSDKVPPELPGSWPWFRGADLDNVCKEEVALAVAWEGGKPKELWSVELGEGHAGPAVYAGCVYMLDYIEDEQADALRCFALDDGTELWRRWYGVQVKRNHGMSRTVPAVTDKYVVTIGPRCHCMCVDRATGELRWGIDMARDYGSKEPLWYTAQCPLVDDDVAVLAPCGETLMMGVSCESGDILWRTPNEGGHKMSHSSVTVATIHGKRMYLYAAVGAVVGVSAEESEPGKLLWECRDFGAQVIAPTPVDVGEGRVFLTAGYGAGSTLMHVMRDGDSFAVKTEYIHSPKEGLACEQHTPLVHEGHLIGILPKDAGTNRKQLICYHPYNGIVWQSGKKVRFGLGPFMVADGKLLILDDDGMLTMAKLSLEGYEQLAAVRILDGHDSWAPLALVGGRLLARDSTRMVCVDLRVSE